MSRPSLKVTQAPPFIGGGAPLAGPATSIRSDLPESEFAHQLRRGFKSLRFVATLEREFRRTHRQEGVTQARVNLWLAILFVVMFSVLSDMVFGAAGGQWVNIIRYGVFLPIMTAAIVIAYSPLHERFYSLACQIGAPLFGAGVVLLEVFAARNGASMISTLVVTTIYSYLMLRMLFYAALRSGIAILGIYVCAALIGNVPTTVFAAGVALLTFTNIIGATVCYSLEKANRTNYLEARLLVEMASRDGLTGIFNRRTFDEHIEKLWQQAARDRVPLALLLIDIDHFKPYNDTCGHLAGDDCLRRVARSLERAARRPFDLVARFGGEEFAILLYDARRSHADDVARRMQLEIQNLNIRHPASSAGPRLTVSIGAASVEPKLGRSHIGFIQLADEALYEAKERGRNRIFMMEKEYEMLNTGSFRKPAVVADPAA